MDELIKKGVFRNRSHAIEEVLRFVKKEGPEKGIFGKTEDGKLVMEKKGKSQSTHTYAIRHQTQVAMLRVYIRGGLSKIPQRRAVPTTKILCILGLIIFCGFVFYSYDRCGDEY